MSPHPHLTNSRSEIRRRLGRWAAMAFGCVAASGCVAGAAVETVGAAAGAAVNVAGATAETAADIVLPDLAGDRRGSEAQSGEKKR